jgi:SnoaL-like domain
VLEDEREIRNLVYEVAHRRDRGDWAGVAELFADATFQTHYPAGYPGVGVPKDEVAQRQPGGHGVQRGAGEVEEIFRRTCQTYEDGLPHTLYLTTNLVVHVDDDRATASAKSYYALLQARPDFALQIISAGRYQDRFDRHDGRWRFTEREIFADFSGDLSHHLAEDPLAYGREFDERHTGERSPG